MIARLLDICQILVQFGEQEYQKQVSVQTRDYQSGRSVKEKESLEMKASKKVTLIYPSDVSRPSYSQRKDIIENVIEHNIKQADRHENQEVYQEPSLETDVWEVFWDIEHNRWYYYNKILGGYEVAKTF